MSEHGFLESKIGPKKGVGAADKYRGAAVAELNLSTPKTISKATALAEALNIMILEDFDVLPVIDNKKFVGFVTSGDIRANLADKTLQDTTPVEALMHRFAKRRQEYQLITPETPLAELESFLEKNSIGFVTGLLF